MKISNEFTDISDLLSHVFTFYKTVLFFSSIFYLKTIFQGIPNFHQFGLDKLITNLELLQLICDNGFE